ncbi:MAG: hypothetical protein DYG89_08355 [Caldilinea sp. CFX5]|nr:hypothetical protein [Caldilinea sp. CFX5]
MNHFWWNLPGPVRFIDQIIQDLRDGKNIIICLPDFAPANLAEAVAYHLRIDSDWCYERLEWAGHRSKPLDLLIHQLIPDPDPNTFWNAKLLLEHEMIRGHWFWLELPNATAWPQWREFMIEYAHACRAYPSYQRPLFIIVTQGIAEELTNITDVCLSTHRWYGYVDRLDMLLFTKHLMPQRPCKPLQKEMIVAMIAELAQWDPYVAQALVEQPLSTLLNPKLTLKAIAAERRWLESRQVPRTWCTGTTNAMEDGRVTTHSALLALSDPGNEMNARIWNAQVRIVFPYLEEQRRRLLTEIGKQLRVPFETEYGMVTHLHELEIGHIANQLNTMLSARIPPEIRRKATRLKEIRNKLAHLEILSAEMVEFMND